jgi:RNA polymerase sigma-70 factor (ECF subfamily)
MATSGTWSTSTSLINRIKQNDPQAWERFTHIYTPLVYTWGRRQGLSQQDAGDLVQDVFTRVFQYIQTFQPESFRGWLWTVTRNQIHKMTGNNPVMLQAPGGSQAYDELIELPADQEASKSRDDTDPSNLGKRQQAKHLLSREHWK